MQRGSSLANQHHCSMDSKSECGSATATFCLPTYCSRLGLPCMHISSLPNPAPDLLLK
jgi:hypothetical protein